MLDNIEESEHESIQQDDEDENLEDINVMAKVWAKKKGFYTYIATSSLFG